MRTGCKYFRRNIPLWSFSYHTMALLSVCIVVTLKVSRFDMKVGGGSMMIFIIKVQFGKNV